jgi:hypothetical protein
MSGIIAVRYRREPIMLMYSLYSTASPSSSGPSDIAVLIGVDTSLSYAMLNFFIRSFVYLAYARRYLAPFAVTSQNNKCWNMTKIH